MQQHSNNRTTRQFTGKHMALIMFGFFGVVIIVNMVLAIFANQSWTGLIVKNSYVASQNFNQKLKEANSQKALGWASHLVYEKGQLVFTISDRKNRPISGLKVEAYLRRPTHENEDQVLRLKEKMPGRFEQDARLSDGVWNAEILAQSSTGKQYRQIFRMMIKKGG